METQDNGIEELYEKTFHKVHSGLIIKGEVVTKMSDSVVVDIGYKSEGFIPIDEFKPEELEAVKIGDELEVMVTRVNDNEGIVSLSIERARKVKAIEQLQDIYKDEKPVEGKITSKVKGGFYVDILGLQAFMPGSQADIKPIKDPDKLIGIKSKFRILKLNSKLTNIVVSRRVILEKERESLRTETLKNLKDDAVMEGVVKNITDYGVFVDLGGIDGLLHISDISWGRITHPSEFFTIGDTIEVIILKYNPETDKVTLGFKQKKPDPWMEIQEKYPVGKKVEGKVVSITDYGAFLEVEEGVEGLIHVSELDWSQRPKHPSKYLDIGETVEAQVIKVDSDERRLSLSIRELKTKPWDLVVERYTVGDKVSGKIRTLTDFGAFVGLPEGIDGLIHISDISWTKHIKHPSEVLKKGQKVEAVILKIEPDQEKMALGVKQLTDDPWNTVIPEKYHLGDEVTCKVLRTTDFGIFADIDNEVEGLIYSSEIDPDRVQSLEDNFKEGDELRARIIKIELEERKIGLSLKNVSSSKEESEAIEDPE
ncbi:MAG: 30S ribosomal protein S1 [Nitrospirota bacterium]|nr:MAG: 30S ribosomal protein S1 [Nitrospirota bacterium]